MSQKRRRQSIIRPNLLSEIKKALDEGFFLFVLIVGEKGFGKTSLAIVLMEYIYQLYFFRDEVWNKVFRHFVFTPQQFYGIYANAKNLVDSRLGELGIDPRLLDMDINADWSEMIDTVRELGDMTTQFKSILQKYRIKGLLIDDIGAHMNRQDTTIYYNEFYQQLFGDLTLIRPYIGVLMATAPAIEDVPRPIIKHVTDIVDVKSRGFAEYKKKKNLVRFKGRSLEGYMKLYSGDDIRWDAVEEKVYSQYEILRHLLSRQVTMRAREAASDLLIDL